MRVLHAGYAEIILANKGLEPNEESWFTQNGGFNVRITLSEEDTWDQLQEGKITTTAMTTDVLANYGRNGIPRCLRLRGSQESRAGRLAPGEACLKSNMLLANAVRLYHVRRLGNHMSKGNA